MVKREKLSAEEVSTAFGPKRVAQIEQILQYLIDEGFVEMIEDIVVWKGTTDHK